MLRCATDLGKNRNAFIIAKECQSHGTHCDNNYLQRCACGPCECGKCHIKHRHTGVGSVLAAAGLYEAGWLRVLVACQDVGRKAAPRVLPPATCMPPGGTSLPGC